MERHEQLTHEQELTSLLVEVKAVLEAVDAALDGESVSDFMESYPIVRKAIDLRVKAYGA